MIGGSVCRVFRVGLVMYIHAIRCIGGEVLFLFLFLFLE